jgi:hypothetical protein
MATKKPNMTTGGLVVCVIVLVIVIILCWLSPDARADGPPPDTATITAIPVAAQHTPPAGEPEPGFDLALGYATGWVLDGVGLEDSTNVNGIAMSAGWTPMSGAMDWTSDLELVIDAAWMTSSVTGFDRRRRSYDVDCASIVSDCGYGDKRGRRGRTTSDNLDVFTYALSARWDAAPMLFGRSGLGNRLDTYLVAGVAGITMQGSAVDDYTTLAGNFGAGASYRITDHIGAAIEADYLLAQEGSDVALAKALLTFSW